MIDPQIKRTLILCIVVVAFAKLVSATYDALFVDSQVEARESAQAMRDEQLRQDQEQNLQRNAERRAAQCLRHQQSRVCSAAKSDRDISGCLRKLRNDQCDRQPRIHLCAVVEELEKCADPFADQSHNGCNRLRSTAKCDEKPAPETRDDLWQIGLHDGMWDGA